MMMPALLEGVSFHHTSLTMGVPFDCGQRRCIPFVDIQRNFVILTSLATLGSDVIISKGAKALKKKSVGAGSWTELCWPRKSGNFLSIEASRGLAYVRDTPGSFAGDNLLRNYK